MSKPYKFLNVACGGTFIQNNSWTNIDFTSHSPSIKKADILNGLPYKDNSFDVIYSSHFIEHIPIEQIESFLDDVYRILRPGGIIRLVTPDLEFLINEYKKNYDKESFKKANFITSLILDQCVRLKSGGKLKEDMDNIYYSNDQEMIKYVELLIGPNAFKYIDSNNISLFEKAIKQIKKDPKFLINIVEMIWVKVVSFFLPGTFKKLNFSNTSIGEKHLWLYDFNSLSQILENASFKAIKKVDFNLSYYPENIFDELDIKDGLPRKGIHQLFIEASKT